MRFPEVPIGAAFDVRNGATPASNEPGYWDGDIPWVGPADLGKLRSRFIEKGERSITPEGYASCGTRMVPAGTIILSTRAPIGHIAIASQPMCFNQGCRGLVPRPMVRTDFAYWCLLARRQHLVAAGQGTTFIELGRDKLRAEHIPLPDPDTQKAIADFLDRETGRVDQLIENKTLFIQTLQEKRQALITYAVTEGLNPNVKMKDRGTATEGERRRAKDVGGRDRQSFERGGGVNFWPEKSREMLRPLKCVCALNPEVLPESTNPEFEFEYIDIGSVTLEGGIVARETMKFANAPSRARKPVKSGDVIISTVRTYLKALALIGPNAEDWIVSTGFAVLRSNSEIDPQFLYYAVQSNPFIESIVAASSGVSYPAINPSTLGSLPISCPHIDVQKAIADFLDRETARIDVLVRKTKRSIDLLKERRSAFITAAVTGQIDIAECKEHKQTDGQLEIIRQEAVS